MSSYFQEKYNAVKYFVKDHETELVYAGGIATGIAITVLSLKQVPSASKYGHIIAPITSEQLQHLIDKPKDLMTYVEPNGLGAVTLVNVAGHVT